MKRSYSDEFKAEAVRLAQSSEVSAAHVARELGLNPNTLYGWIEKCTVSSEDPGGGVEDLSAENKRLRRELKRAELERDILKKAVSIFSKELP
jgi:transposase